MSGNLYTSGEDIAWWTFGATFSVFACLNACLIYFYIIPSLNCAFSYYIHKSVWTEYALLPSHNAICIYDNVHKYVSFIFSLLICECSSCIVLLSTCSKSSGRGERFIVILLDRVPHSELLNSSSFFSILLVWNTYVFVVLLTNGRIFVFTKRNGRSVLLIVFCVINVVMYLVFTLIIILFAALPTPQSDSPCPTRVPQQQDNTKTKVPNFLSTLIHTTGIIDTISINNGRCRCINCVGYRQLQFFRSVK